MTQMKNYKGYLVSDDGIIVNRWGKILKPRRRGKYFSVRIHQGNVKNGNESIHRIVAELFLPKMEGKNFVNHKNGDKSDNRVQNLEWVNRSENQKHAYEIGLQKPKSKISREMIIQEYSMGLNGTEISKKYSVDNSRIYKVIKEFKLKSNAHPIAAK